MRAIENGHTFRITTKWTNDLAEAVDSVGYKYYRSNIPNQIESVTDWLALYEIVKIYERFFQKEIQDYLRINAAIKSEWGYLEDKTTKKGGEANVRQLGQVPFYLHTLIKVIWPYHKFDRKFNERFFKTFRRFATAERI